MSKKKLHDVSYKVRHFSPWYFFVAALIFGSISVYSLRQNNLGMIKLRDAVFTADEKDGDIEGALRDLRQYMYSHMNTNLSTGTNVNPPIQLKHEYERLVETEKAKAGQANDQVYTQAQKFCEAKYPTSFSGGPRVPCIRDYVSKNTVKEQTIPDALYKFDFVSPSWTPDLAGWTLLLSAVFFALFALKLILDSWVKHDLNKQM